MFPKLNREFDTNQDEVFEIFEVQNQTELQEEIMRRRKAFIGWDKNQTADLDDPQRHEDKFEGQERRNWYAETDGEVS